jgi:XTP/dITP diphosphohydrolase
VTPDQISLATPEIREEGSSHQANAQAKVLAWSQGYQGKAIASDGGLVVPALGDRWDSMLTRRFSSANDAERARDLLILMASLTGRDRRAYWLEAVAVADSGRLIHTLSVQSGEGCIALDVHEGLIKDGFWVGAVWYFPQLGKRYAELTVTELQQAGDHWTALRKQVRQLFR